jgi:hypothetical protein
MTVEQIFDYVRANSGVRTRVVFYGQGSMTGFFKYSDQEMPLLLDNKWYFRDENEKKIGLKGSTIEALIPELHATPQSRFDCNKIK